MSATCRDHTATAKELLETCDELGVDDQNVRQEAKDDIRKVIRRLKRSAKRKAVPPWSVPTEVLILTLSPGHNSVRDQERRGIGCLEINPAKFRLCWQLLRGVHVHVRRGENGTGLTPTIANLSAGHVLDNRNGKVELAALRLVHLFCSWSRNVFGAPAGGKL